MKNKKPLVSILIPVYNVEEYLEECLESLVNQTLKDIEIVCVNDGSTDSSLEILKKYEKKDDRIVIVNKKNGGLPSARNAGLKVAKGKYVGFVDSDDFVALDMFEKMSKQAMKDGSDIVVCGGVPYPNENDAPEWLRKILSPKDIVYKNGSLKALFDEPGAQPFLWRNLVKRELIEKNKLFLEESIILGEDVAFQFKIFSYAKAVSFMSNKFYYYRYSRPNSIMNSGKFNDYGSRVYRHVLMVENSIETLKKSGKFKETSKRFFEWAIDFIYWDFIKVCAADKPKIADLFKRLFEENGFLSKANEIDRYFVDNYNFITKFAGKTFEEPAITLVAIVENDVQETQELLDSIVKQSFKNMEVVVYENGSGFETHRVLFDYMNKFDCISARTGEWSPVSEKYNDAIKSAKGKYICFVDSLNMLENSTVVENIVSKFEDEKVDLVGFKKGHEGKEPVKQCECAKFNHFAYIVSKIRENVLGFEDLAFYTGCKFFTEYCLKSKNVYFVSSFSKERNKKERNFIFKEEAKLVLKAMVYLLKVAEKHGLEELSKEVSNCLNTNKYAKLIADATFGFCAQEESVKNEKEDFHTEIFKLLVEANKLAKQGEFDGAITKTLAVFIEKRHLFLEQF
ncbi:MAG: glycosyltransferase [Clostridia bacterium]|nr:glycosyltransferase [Clostridia bacterium]